VDIPAAVLGNLEEASLAAPDVEDAIRPPVSLEPVE
jgi:hypothetical protein